MTMDRTHHYSDPAEGFTAAINFGGDGFRIDEVQAHPDGVTVDIVATRHIPQPRRWGILKRPDLEVRETIFTTDQDGPSREIIEGEYLTVDITSIGDPLDEDGEPKKGITRIYPIPPSPKPLTWRERRRQRRRDRELDALEAAEYD